MTTGERTGGRNESSSHCWVTLEEEGDSEVQTSDELIEDDHYLWLLENADFVAALFYDLGDAFFI